MVRCGLPFVRISIQSSNDNDATCNGNDHPDFSETKEVSQEILTEVVSSGMTRSIWLAGHLHQEDLAPSCGGSPKETHVPNAPGHLEVSAGQSVGQPIDPTKGRQNVGRTSSFPLTRTPARTPCHLTKGTPGARLSKVCFVVPKLDVSARWSGWGGRFIPGDIVGVHTLYLLTSSWVVHDRTTEHNHTQQTGSLIHY